MLTSVSLSTSVVRSPTLCQLCRPGNYHLCGCRACNKNGNVFCGSVIINLAILADVPSTLCGFNSKRESTKGLTVSAIGFDDANLWFAYDWLLMMRLYTACLVLITGDLPLLLVR